MAFAPARERSGRASGATGPAHVADDPCAGLRTQGFALSLAIASGGEASPAQAAEAQSGVTGWRILRTDSVGTTLVAERHTRHAIEGLDGTWQVDAAEDVGLAGGAHASWLRIADEFTGAVLLTVVFPPRAVELGPPRGDPDVAP